MIGSEDRAQPTTSAVSNDDRQTGGSDHRGSPAVDWSQLVELVQSGSTTGMDRLYRLYARGIRFHVCRQLGPRELDDRVHDIFLTIVASIQKGDVREPERLTGFVRTIIRRQIAGYINESVVQRKEEVELDSGIKVRDVSRTPEQTMLNSQQRDLVQHVLERLNQRDREILTRFYLFEQSQEEICSEMELSETQFRLLKSRAKTRFGELGKKKLQRAALSQVFLRVSASASH